MRASSFFIVENQQGRGDSLYVSKRGSFLREESLVSRSVSRDLPSAADRYWMEIVTEIVNPASAHGTRMKERENKKKKEKDRERTQTRHLVDKRAESARCVSGIWHFYVKIGDFSRLKRTCLDKPRHFLCIGANSDAKKLSKLSFSDWWNTYPDANILDNLITIERPQNRKTL